MKFYIIKKILEKKAIKVKTIDQKKHEALKLFKKMIKKGYRKRIFTHCKYDELFEDKIEKNKDE